MKISKRINRLFDHRNRSRRAVHFLHVGKAAGTQVKQIAARSGGRIIAHKHDINLRDLPKDAAYFFSIRDPISRFYSGFYSRQRKGQPTYFVEWTAAEEAVFREFRHANDLAEALFSDGVIGLSAAQAMISIRHTGQNLTSWFLRHGNILEVRPPVWIIRQDRFDDDLRITLGRIGLADLYDGPQQRAHANSYDKTPPLSDKAKANLKRWYAQDYEFIRVCNAWLAANSKETSASGQP